MCHGSGMNVLGYLRRSTDRQDLSFDRQKMLIRRWAFDKDHDVVDFVQDDVSGGVAPLDRPKFVQALDAAEAREAALVFTDPSRLARDTLGALAAVAEAQSRGVPILFADDPQGIETEIGEMLFVMKSAIATLERRRIGRLTRETMAAKREKGHPMGRAPFGWRHASGTLEPVPEEQAALARMRELRAAGRSFQAIAQDVDGLGGRRWHATTVRRVLGRPA